MAIDPQTGGGGGGGLPSAMAEQEAAEQERARERGATVEHLRHQVAEARRLSQLKPTEPGYRHDVSGTAWDAVIDALETAAGWIEKGNHRRGERGR